MPYHSHHNHKQCISQALHQADRLCHQHGQKLTPIRKKILELVWQSHKPIKAYDLLAMLDKDDGASAPPTVYRALDFLLDQRLVHKIESLNSFVGCPHPGDEHQCQFFVCNTCHNVTEMCHDELSQVITASCQKNGYRVESMILEIHGQCPECLG
ncbi:MAG: transcriptional repressor [Alphaproteobacteria bacterium]|nr:transcriptional repressor [Alphaproteobacteria bacterium]